MNENRKLYIMFSVVVGVMVVIIGICMAGNRETREMIKEIDKKIQSEELNVFYLAKPTCHYCVLLEPVTETLKEEYQLTYNHIDVSKLNTAQLKQILDKFKVNLNTFGTPLLVITQNGKVVDQLNGYADENVVFELFQKVGLISNEASLAFQYIDYDTFQKQWKSEEKKLIMIGQSGAESVQARNELKPYIKENGLTISYMDIAETGDTETYSKFLKLIGHSEQTTYPILMITQNGQIISEINETTASAYEEFLRTNGYLG